MSVLKTSLRLTFGCCAAIFVLLIIFPVEFAGIYDVAPAMMPQMVVFLRVSSIYMLLMAHVFVLRAFYQATRQEESATIFSLLEGVVIVIPLFFLLSEWSVNVMWAASFLSALLSLFWLVMYMRLKAKREGFDNFLMMRTDSEGTVWEASINATIPAAMEAVAEVEQFCASRELSSKQSYAAQITVEELCVNIAEHGGLKETDQIDIFLRLLGDRLFVKVRDMGKPFNPTKFLDEQGEEFLGLFMVRSLTSNIEYARILGFNTTIVTIDKRE